MRPDPPSGWRSAHRQDPAVGLDLAPGGPAAARGDATSRQARPSRPCHRGPAVGQAHPLRTAQGIVGRLALSPREARASGRRGVRSTAGREEEIAPAGGVPGIGQASPSPSVPPPKPPGTKQAIGPAWLGRRWEKPGPGQVTRPGLPVAPATNPKTRWSPRRCRPRRRTAPTPRQPHQASMPPTSTGTPARRSQGALSPRRTRPRSSQG